MDESGVGDELKVVAHGEGWALAGPAEPRFTLANEYLSYLSDRRYSPRTVRAYAFDLGEFKRSVQRQQHCSGPRLTPTGRFFEAWC